MSGPRALSEPLSWSSQELKLSSQCHLTKPARRTYSWEEWGVGKWTHTLCLLPPAQKFLVLKSTCIILGCTGANPQWQVVGLGPLLGNLGSQLPSNPLSSLAFLSTSHPLSLSSPLPCDMCSGSPGIPVSPWVLMVELENRTQHLARHYITLGSGLSQGFRRRGGSQEPPEGHKHSLPEVTVFS